MNNLGQSASMFIGFKIACISLECNHSDFSHNQSKSVGQFTEAVMIFVRSCTAAEFCRFNFERISFDSGIDAI